MKRLITGDLQLDDNPRDRYRLDFFLQELPRFITKHQASMLYILGDLTEKHDKHPASLVNAVVDGLVNLTQFCEVVILQGNHDFTDKSYPFFSFVEHFDRITWISQPTWIGNDLWLPHTSDYKKDWKGLDLSGRDYIFAHNIFDGGKSGLKGIPPIIFPDDAFVIAGDVHEPQSYDCINYVGSPFLVDFGDNYQPRLLLLDDNAGVKSIKVQWQQKRLVDVIWDAENSDYQHPGGLNNNDIVKMRVHLKMEHVPDWAKIRESVRKWALDRKLIVNTIQPVVEYVPGERAQVVKSVKRSDAQYIDAFVQRAGLDAKVAALGKEIINSEK